MSFVDYLEKVRQEPEGKRRRLLMIWTVLGTALIVILWLANIFLLRPGADPTEIAQQKLKWAEWQSTAGEAGERIYLGWDLLKTGVSDLFK